MKHKYEVTIREILEMKVKVEADSREDAERRVEQGWKASEYILDAADFSGVEFHSKKVPDRGRDEGR